MLANNQITRPAGAATEIALPNTNRVLSNIELTKTFPICGFLYGGSSNIKEEGIPFRIVLDNILEINSVINMPNKTTNNTAIVANIDEAKPDANPPNKYHCNCY